MAADPGITLLLHCMTSAHTPLTQHLSIYVLYTVLHKATECDYIVFHLFCSKNNYWISRIVVRIRRSLTCLNTKYAIGELASLLRRVTFATFHHCSSAEPWTSFACDLRKPFKKYAFIMMGQTTRYQGISGFPTYPAFLHHLCGAWCTHQRSFCGRLDLSRILSNKQWIDTDL
jgi:hypothetical protein